MSLVWHIVRKDFRRLAGPLALWLALVVTHVLLLFFWEGQMGFNPVAFEGKRYFVNTCGAIVMGVGFILAAWLVMEDSLVSTQAFWRTRALGGLRLLAAKALGAFLMFSVLPVLAVTPVWLWCGFSARELGHAALELGLAQALCSLGAFALGSITETSGQFLVRLIGGAIILPLYLAYVLGAFSRNIGPSNGSELLVAGVMFMTPLAMTVHQFVTRRLGRTWLLLAVGIGLMWVGARCPWNLTAWFISALRPDAMAPSSLVFTAGSAEANPLESLNNRVPVTLEGRVTGMAPGTHVRVDSVQSYWVGGDGGAGPRFTGVVANGEPAGNAIRRAAGLPEPAVDETTWSASTRERGNILDDPRPLKGVVKATLLHSIVLGELPLQAGAELRSGASYLRVKSVQPIDDHLVVLIEEREAWIMADLGIYSHSYVSTLRRIRPAAEGFVVINRARRIDVVPAIDEVGTMMADSIMVGRRRLVITPPEGAGKDWLEGAVIVKVRFTPRGKIQQAIKGELRAAGR